MKKHICMLLTCGLIMGLFGRCPSGECYAKELKTRAGVSAKLLEVTNSPRAGFSVYVGQTFKRKSAITADTVNAVASSAGSLTEEAIPEQQQLYLQDIDMLAGIVEAEAGNQGYMGKRLVASVILNRVDSDIFPNTVHDVLTQHRQFSTYTDGAYLKWKDRVSEETLQAVHDEIEHRTDPDIFYFTAGRYNESGRNAYKHGSHYFSYLKKRY